MDKFVGKRLDGRYEIKEVIGVGGMAVVYKAYDNIEDRIVAIKILKEEFSSNEEFLRRFKNESKAIAVLSHPNIVKVFDVSFGEIFQYIVMEYIDGITLKTYIEQHGSLPWKDAANFTIQILRALQHAHDKGIVHRDIKPQNIMVLKDGTIKVTDFGIARFARNEYKTITDKAIGSVHYISPEQAKGELTDEKTDIYSVGVMLYEMLTGTLPFEAESAVSVAIMQLQSEPKLPSTINPSIPRGIEQITMRAMRKEANERYSSAAEMLRDLERFKRDPDLVFDTPVFVDDSPTKFVDDLNDNEDGDDEEDKSSDKAPIVPILTGIAVVFVVFLVVFGIFAANFLFGSSGESFPCPNLIGQKFDEVEESEDYTLEVVQDYRANTEYGVIFDQNPAAGKDIKKGTVIKIYVSMGGKTVKVPDVSNYDVSRATSILKTEGLEYEIVERPDENVAANTVIETSPARDSNVYVGTKITVYVSTGAPTVYVDLPDVRNVNIDDAKRLIEKAGLVVGTVTTVESDPEMKDIVISQDPTPSSSNKQAGKGTAVNLQIGSGEKTNKFTLTINLPNDYVSQYGKLSAWTSNGTVKQQESSELDFWNGSTYNFTFTTKDDTMSVLIKLNAKDSSSYDNYASFEIDCTTGTLMNTFYFSDYPKKSDDSSSSSSSSR